MSIAHWRTSQPEPLELIVPDTPTRSVRAGPVPARTVLITGGCGYVGSHVAAELLEHGHDVVLLDNLSNSQEAVVGAIERSTGRAPSFLLADVLDPLALRSLFSTFAIDAVVHCAGLKAVAESVRLPALYYRQNVQGALVLLDAMQEAGVRRIVFSSSATVYGTPEQVPIAEDAPLRPASPYGRTKLVVEQMLRDQCKAQRDWSAMVLRYFNPAGAHPGGHLGDAPAGVPNNLFPIMGEVATGGRDALQICGTDYPTPDGTCVRDYVHVVDIARAHRLAIEPAPGQPRWLAVNLGTGIGYSVNDVVAAYRRASGARLPAFAAPRRDGDVPQCYADPSLAASIWGWRAERGLDQMCSDAWLNVRSREVAPGIGALQRPAA